MNHQSMKPYQIGFARNDKCEIIAARGPLAVMTQLSMLEGAEWSGDPLDPESFVYFPMNRLNILAAEAVATPSAVSPEYKAWRCQYLRSPLVYQAGVDQALHEGGWEPRPLLSHQIDFLAMLGRLHPRSAINASEQGTGKTATGWMALHLWKSRRALIICPKSLVHEWKRELDAAWLGDKPIDCFPLDRGSIKARAELIADQMDSWLRPAAIVINYEVVESLLPAILKYAPDSLICDESWRLKNPAAKVTKAVIQIADRCAHVLLLTGTPIGNHIGDLWSQLRIMGRDLMPETYNQFLHRYATLVPLQLGPRTVWKPTGVSDPPGLMKRLERVWYRATKAACLDLPPKRYSRIGLRLPQDIAQLYEAVQENGEIPLGNPLSLAADVTVDLRLHQICGGFRPRYNQESGKMDMLQIVNCPKIAWLKEWTRDVLEGNPSTRAIVWAAYTHELERIAEVMNHILGGGKAVVCWGGTDNDTLEEWKHAFKSRSDEGVQVLVCQLKKMAFGHNLQECDYNIYFSNSWSYVVRSQSEDRSHRNGRADAVQYIDLLIERSLDIEIMQALDKKQSFATRLAPGTASREALVESP